jgi:hypothetical protein
MVVFAAAAPWSAAFIVAASTATFTTASSIAFVAADLSVTTFYVVALSAIAFITVALSEATFAAVASSVAFTTASSSIVLVSKPSQPPPLLPKPPLQSSWTRCCHTHWVSSTPPPWGRAVI